MYEEINQLSNKQLAKELKRLRPIAEKRIKALMSAGKTSYIKDIGKLSKVKTDLEEVQELSRFLHKPFSKVSMINKFEKDMLKKLRDNGYDIKDKDISLFNDFMGELKAKNKGRRIPDSTRVVNVFIQAQRLKMSRKALNDNLEYWKEHLKEMEALKGSRAKTKYSANYIVKRLGKKFL